MEEMTTLGTARIEVDPDRPSLLILYLDGVPSSAIDLHDAEYLEFEYMQHMRILAESARPRGTKMRVMHIGGAGCALARAFASSHPQAHQMAVEIDDVLATKVREWFPLPRAPQLKIRVAEGRSVMKGQAGRGWDIIVRDAFSQGTVPYQLMTYEAALDAKNALAPDGVNLINLSRHYRPELATIMAAFDHVVAITDPAVWSGKRYGNITVGASSVPWPDLHRQVYRLPLPARVYRDLAPSAAPLHDVPE